MVDPVERRLSAILAADVVGYSRLMGVDESGTLNALRVSRSTVIDPVIGRFGGRIVKTTGDGFLVEFRSVVDSIACAAEIQSGMKALGSETDQRLVLRIGINLGDIIIQDDDIFGDGVNIAARLEQLCAPGGVCVSQAAYDQVRDKLALTFADLGEQTLKNIARPIRAYALLQDAHDITAARKPFAYRLSRRGAIAAATVVLVVAALLLGTLRNPEGDTARLPALEKPTLSIAVLPFENLSGDAGQDYFADALTEDLTSDLSRISGSFVISRSTAATYRGRDLDSRQIAAELGVRYLLEGTVRRGTNDVRVSVELTDGSTAQQVWSERYEKTVGDMYTFQNEVTGRVARTLNLELKEAISRQMERGGTESVDANDLALRAWAELWTKPQNPETNRAALDLAKRAMAIDPDNVEALGVVAYAYARSATFGWEIPRPEAVRRGIAAGEHALAVDPKNADVVYALGFLYYRNGETQKALEMMRQCLSLNRNHAPAYFFSGLIYMRLGKPAEAIDWIQRAFAISPRDPLRSVWYASIGRAQILIGKDREAIETAGLGIVANPDHSQNYAVLASAYAHLGQIEKAADALSKFRILEPEATLNSYFDQLAGQDPLARKTYQRLIDGLALAGFSDG